MCRPSLIAQFAWEIAEAFQRKDRFKFFHLPFARLNRTLLPVDRAGGEHFHKAESVTVHLVLESLLHSLSGFEHSVPVAICPPEPMPARSLSPW